jgi:hypothetical protein
MEALSAVTELLAEPATKRPLSETIATALPEAVMMRSWSWTVAAKSAESCPSSRSASPASLAKWALGAAASSTSGASGVPLTEVRSQ